MLLSQLKEECSSLGTGELMDECDISRSQLYEWMKGVDDRKPREPKDLDKEAVINGVDVIKRYPYFGGQKGQVYMIYHQLGYLAIHSYNLLKKIIRSLIWQEVYHRNLLPEKEGYEHERARGIGEIWAEDFTYLFVAGQRWYVSLLIDVASQYYLGWEVSPWKNDTLVSVPVRQALEENNGIPPQRFLLSDNGSEYRSMEHEKLLSGHDIVHKLIPSCQPEYNGSMECGVKEFKQAFYCLWTQLGNGADKEKKVADKLRSAVAATIEVMNKKIPRPCLQGVTPYDVHSGMQEEKIQNNLVYYDQEKERPDKVLLKRGELWKTIKGALSLSTINSDELMTIMFFFTRRPLRNIANYHKKGSG